MIPETKADPAWTPDQRDAMLVALRESSDKLVGEIEAKGQHLTDDDRKRLEDLRAAADHAAQRLAAKGVTVKDALKTIGVKDDLVARFPERRNEEAIPADPRPPEARTTPAPWAQHRPPVAAPADHAPPPAVAIDSDPEPAFVPAAKPPEPHAVDRIVAMIDETTRRRTATAGLDNTEKVAADLKAIKALAEEISWVFSSQGDLDELSRKRPADGLSLQDHADILRAASDRGLHTEALPAAFYAGLTLLYARVGRLVALLKSIQSPPPAPTP